MIEESSLRLKNIEEQLLNFLITYSVHLLFFVTLIMHLQIFPSLNVQVSFFIPSFLHCYKFVRYSRMLFDKKLNRQMPFARCSFFLKVFENGIYAVTWVMLVIYLYDQERFNISIAISSMVFLASCINCFCIKYEETPCNATMQLLSKILIVLRFLLCFSVLMKIDHRTSWDWSTAFWPYWCSFAI